MKSIFQLCIYIVITSFTIINAQTPIPGLDACSFNIINNRDTIQFLKVNKDINTKKPVIVFCQGSLPIPLVFDFGGGKRSITGINNFDYQKIAEKYHIIIISPPSIPLIVHEDNLNSQYAYVTNRSDEHSYPKDYNLNNYLEKYIERGNSVIEFLISQDWVNKENILIVGHSQGARVAVKIASQNKNISALGFLSGNPLGRVDQFIRQSRLLEQKGEITEEKAQENINNIYKWWEWANANIDKPSERGEDSPRNIVSFSTPTINDLINIKIPVFVAYGTKDIVASYCDLLPIDFVRAEKKNYKVKPYIGLDHNYMEVDSLGKPIVEKCYWDTVMTDFIDWVENK